MFCDKESPHDTGQQKPSCRLHSRAKLIKAIHGTTYVPGSCHSRLSSCTFQYRRFFLTYLNKLYSAPPSYLTLRTAASSSRVPLPFVFVNIRLLGFELRLQDYCPGLDCKGVAHAYASLASVIHPSVTNACSWTTSPASASPNQTRSTTGPSRREKANQQTCTNNEVGRVS